jgi:hypothetical protein
MNGATALPLARRRAPPKTPMVINMGMSQYFRRARRKLQNSITKSSIHIFPLRVRLALHSCSASLPLKSKPAPGKAESLQQSSPHQLRRDLLFAYLQFRPRTLPAAQRNLQCGAADTLSRRSLRVGFPPCASCRHWRMGTSTAACSPRLVRSCGTASQAPVQQFAEAWLGIMNRPSLHLTPI